MSNLTCDINTFMSVLSVIAILAIIIVAVTAVVVYHIHKKELERLTSYEINVSAKIDEEIPNILEKYVNSIFSDYRMKFLEAQYFEKYISDEQQEQIRADFAEICARRLSPAMMDKLSLFWKKEAITEVLADKIYLIIVNYVVSHNAVKEGPNEEKTNII